MGQTHFSLPCSWCRDYRTGVWPPLEPRRVRGACGTWREERESIHCVLCSTELLLPTWSDQIASPASFPFQCIRKLKESSYTRSPLKDFWNYTLDHLIPWYFMSMPCQKTSAYLRINMEQKYPADRLTLYDLIWTFYHEIWIQEFLQENSVLLLLNAPVFLWLSSNLSGKQGHMVPSLFLVRTMSGPADNINFLYDSRVGSCCSLLEKGSKG